MTDEYCSLNVLDAKWIDSIACIRLSAFVPRGMVHAFKNVASTSGRVLRWTIPGSNGDYFHAVQAMKVAGGFNPERFGEISRRFVTEFIG
jgi:hypothetical protein